MIIKFIISIAVLIAGIITKIANVPPSISYALIAGGLAGLLYSFFEARYIIFKEKTNPKKMPPPKKKK